MVGKNAHRPIFVAVHQVELVIDAREDFSNGLELSTMLGSAILVDSSCIL